MQHTREQRLAQALEAKKLILELEERIITPLAEELRNTSIQNGEGFTLTSPGRGSVQVSKPGVDKEWEEIEVSPKLSEAKINSLIKQGVLIRVPKFKAGSKPSVTFKLNA